MSDGQYRKPLPEPDELSRPFWDAARRHELRIQSCIECRRYIHPPRPRCPDCRSDQFEWPALSGRGWVHTYGVVHHRGGVPGFEDDVPYVIALVELVEQPNLLITTNIVGCDPEDMVIDAPVEVNFDDVAPECTLVKFRLAGESPRSP